MGLWRGAGWYGPHVTLVARLASGEYVSGAVIDGVALYKRHLKGAAGKVGRIVERPRAIDASNVKRVQEGVTKKKESLFAVK